MSTEATVYGDKTVLITNLYIKIYKYYFPLGTSKTIFFSEIDHIVYHPNEKKKVVWGATTDHLNNWFPLDQIRGYKRGYFEIYMKNKSIRPCFSPFDPDTALKVIQLFANSRTNQNQQTLETNYYRESSQNREPYENREILEQNDIVLHRIAESQNKQKFVQFQPYDDTIINDTNKKQRMPLRDITNNYIANQSEEQKYFKKETNFYSKQEDKISYNSQSEQEENVFSQLSGNQQQFQDLTQKKQQRINMSQ